MNWRIDKTLGYVYTIDKSIAFCSKGGKVMQHTYVFFKHTGTLPKENEVIHHIDGNRANNHISNLMLMTRSDHAKLHANERYSHKKEVNCICGKTFFTGLRSKRKVCSKKCYLCMRKKTGPFSKFEEEDIKILLSELIWKMPTIHIAKIFNVSDKTIEKRCKKYGIPKPPRGYWVKKKFGHLNKTIEEEKIYE